MKTVYITKNKFPFLKEKKYKWNGDFKKIFKDSQLLLGLEKPVKFLLNINGDLIEDFNDINDNNLIICSNINELDQNKNIELNTISTISFKNENFNLNDKYQFLISISKNSIEENNLIFQILKKLKENNLNLKNFFNFQLNLFNQNLIEEGICSSFNNNLINEEIFNWCFNILKNFNLNNLNFIIFGPPLTGKSIILNNLSTILLKKI